MTCSEAATLLLPLQSAELYHLPHTVICSLAAAAPPGFRPHTADPSPRVLSSEQRRALSHLFVLPVCRSDPCVCCCTHPRDPPGACGVESKIRRIRSICIPALTLQAGHEVIILLNFSVPVFSTPGPQGSAGAVAQGSGLWEEARVHREIPPLNR